MSADKHPESVPALLGSLRHLAATQPKAVRGTVHIYPAEIYTNEASNHGETSAAGAAKARDRRITSWKMTEHMYFQKNNPFPTLARGLFTEELEDEDDSVEGVTGAEARLADVNLREDEARAEASVGSDGAAVGKGRRDRIVARGYDKFFNIDEVAWTNVSAHLPSVN